MSTEGHLVKVCNDTANDGVCDANETVFASFVYNGDGQRVKSVMGAETILFVGAHYEVNITSGAITKYYFFGASRIAMRKYTIPVSMSVEFMIGDHPFTALRASLGSTSITTDANGVKVSEMRYEACPLRCTPGVLRKGETRYTWTNTPANTSPTYAVTKYQFTGQYSYAAELGLLYYGARFYDPALGRFSSADSIIPEQTQGTQAWDRYAGMNNNPVRYNDPTGHNVCDEEGNCYNQQGKYRGIRKLYLPPSPKPPAPPQTPETLKTLQNSSGNSGGNNPNRTLPLCLYVTTQANCQKTGKIVSVVIFALDTASGGLSLVGMGLELVGLLGGPVGEGGALGTYQVLNATEGYLGLTSAALTVGNDIFITGETYLTSTPQPELVLGSDSTIAVTLAFIGAIDPEPTTDTLFNAAVWVNDLYRLRGGDGFMQLHIGLNLHIYFGPP